MAKAKKADTVPLKGLIELMFDVQKAAGEVVCESYYLQGVITELVRQLHADGLHKYAGNLMFVFDRSVKRSKEAIERLYKL